ncbi:MAG: zinc ABC transporter substrate-binding protein [Alphaproteobacteria bacterium]
MFETVDGIPRGWATVMGRHGFARLALALVLSAAGLANEGAVAAEGPRVVVSIPPLHSLIAGVMAGVGEPVLLIEGAASPHAYALRPSAARALAEADAVFWVGPDLETFLPKPLKSLAGASRVVTVLDEPGIAVLPVRVGGDWEEADDHIGEEPDAEHGTRDPHVWLDPRNAQRIVAIAGATLSEIDPANAAAYRGNAARLQSELTQLERELAAKLAPVRGVPFIVFHDAYHYFEARFELTTVGAFALSPGMAPGARRVAELRARLVETGAVCVFVEPQFEPAVVKAAVASTGARIAVLDPLGAGLTYSQLMHALAGSLLACLGGH